MESETTFLEPPGSARSPTLVRRRDVDLRLVPGGFLALIVIGTILLLLPWSHQPGQSLGLLDALFLSTSATCVTGLTTVNVAETFNSFGQVVLLLLIQFGGLGIFTASISLVLLSGQRLSLADEYTIRATVGRLRKVRPLDVFIYACVFVAVLELAGTLALFVTMSANFPEAHIGRTLWEAAFHSVSAFCNAGISIYPEGMARWRHQPGVLAIVNALVIAGGIGLMTLINLRYFYFWRRDPRRRGPVTLQTKLSVITALVLLAIGFVITMGFEVNHTSSSESFWERVSWAMFHSTMSRTAGFNVVDVGAMNPPTLLGTIVLMFIGGAPGSMAGGIKTVTFAVLVLTTWNALRRSENIQLLRRRISPATSGVAIMIGLLATMLVLIGVGLLMLTEQGRPAAQASQNWLGIVFEAVSAFGTVGLSTGITPLLTAWGKLVIIALMFTGRVAPLMLSIYLARPPYPWHTRHPVEEVSLG